MNSNRVPIFLSFLVLFLVLPVNNLFFPLSSPVKARALFAFAQEPPAGESLLDEGVRLFRANQFKEAIVVLREYTAQVTDDYVSYYYLGFSYFRTGDKELAKDALTKCKGINPDFVPARMGLGAIYESEGELQDALDEYNSIIILSSKESGEAKTAEKRLTVVKAKLTGRHLQKAQQFADLNDLDGAVRELSAAIELSPKDTGIYLALGGLYIRQNKLKEATGMYEQAREITPENPQIRMTLGEIYFSTNYYNEAQAEFSEVIRLVPDSELADSAKKKLKSAEGMEKSRTYFIEVARALREERFDDALAVSIKLLDIEPDNPYVHYNLGLIYANKKMYAEAIGALDKAIEISPDNIEANYQLAVVYDDMGKFDKAIIQYEAVIALGKEGAEETEKSVERLSLLKGFTVSKDVEASVRELMEAGKYEEAVIEAERILTVKEDEETLFTLGKIYLIMKIFDKAIVTFDRVIRINPVRWEAHLFMGQGYEAMKRFEESAISYNKVVSNAPETTEGQTAKKMLTRVRVAMHFKKANDYRDKGDMEGALREIDALLQKEPDNPVALFNAGVLYYILQKQDKAIPYLKRTLEIEPSYVSAQLQLGFVYESQRKYRDAESAYNAVLLITKEGKDAEIARTRLGLLEKEEAFSTHMRAAQKLIEEGKFEQALGNAKEIIAIAPENYIAQYTAGFLYDRLLMFDEAEAAFKESIRVNPKYYNAHFGLARVYEQQGYFEDAREYYKLTISNGEGTREAQMAAARLRRLRKWSIQAYLSNTLSEVETSTGAKSSGTNTVHGLTLSYDLYATAIRSLTVSTAINNNIYYETQRIGTGYNVDLKWEEQFSRIHTYTAGGGYSYSVFDKKPSYKSYKYFVGSTLRPDAIPTYITMRYDYSDTVSFVNPLADMVLHNISFSVTQKTSDWDAMSGSYSYSTNINKHPLGNNFAYRYNGLFLNYNKRIIPQLYFAGGYNIGLRGYMNPDSTTLFTEYRKDVITALNMNISYRLSDKGFIYLKGGNTWESTNIPSLKEEQLADIGERLADPIPRVGGWDRRRTTVASADMNYRLSEMVYLTAKIGHTWAVTDPEDTGSYKQFELNVSLQSQF